MKEEHKNTQYRRADETISLDELKSFLWGAATRLRGQIDAAGYKEYIFPLLFFKRISDVYDEQFEDFVAEVGVEYAGMQAAELVIRIPDGAHWRDVREVTENVGQRLVEAFIAIEQVNPGEEADGRVIGGLDGIFGPKDGWTNKWLAEQLGKDQTTISKWCTNSSQPDLGNLMQIAKILDVELTDLVRFEEFKNETE